VLKIKWNKTVKEILVRTHRHHVLVLLEYLI